MIVVIQCAATKRTDASLHAEDGRRLIFVADPSAAPSASGVRYARPDDYADDGMTWREKLIAYNSMGDNPYGVAMARDLYQHAAYRGLADRFGIENTFILSAGWGLIRSDFLTPYYDITYSKAVRASAPYKFRRKTDVYADFRQLPKVSDAEVVFFGGKDYIPLFCSLTDGHAGPRTIFYNSVDAPNAPGCMLQRFETRTRTNWHYECAREFIAIRGHALHAL